MYGNTENCIEWIKDEEKATLSLTQRRTISRVKKLAAKHPDISPLKEVSDARREISRKNMLALHSKQFAMDSQ